MTIIQAMAAVIIVVALAVVLFPVFTTGHRPNPGILCLSNIKQIGTGMLIYATEHGDRLPPAPAWMDKLGPHTKNPEIFRCPVVKKQSPEGHGYAYNRHLEKTLLTALESPNEVPLVYESINLARHAADFVTSMPNPGRHGGKNTIVHADTSAKAYPRVVPGG